MAEESYAEESAEHGGDKFFTTAEFAMGPVPGTATDDMYCTPGNHSSGMQGTK